MLFFPHKRILSLLTALVYMWSFSVTIVPFAYALPQGEVVVSGEASFSQPDAQSLHITTSDKVIINYDQFNIGSSERVQFFQPSASSIALNRIVGQDPSQIFGQLSANGQIMLVNPNGIFFGPQSVINTASFMASTLSISDEDFLNGQYYFQLSPDAAGSEITQMGNITVDTGGVVGLFAPRVFNGGSVMAREGKVILASGERMSLDFTGDGLVNFIVEGAQQDALLENTGTLSAPGGEVLLAVEAAGEVIGNVINNEGVIAATSLIDDQGTIRLVSQGGGMVRQQGLLDVSSQVQGQDAGRVLIEARDIVQAGRIQANAWYDRAGVIDLLAENITIPNGAEIWANGMLTGTGGIITIYAQNQAIFQSDGRIEARGGSEGGDGGFVEVSGKKGLIFQGLVDTRAPQGYAGWLVIDPEFLEITTDPDDADGTFDKLNVTTLVNNLDLGNVQVLADYVITVNADIDSTANLNAFDLELQSENIRFVADTIALRGGLEVDGAALLSTGSTGLSITSQSGDVTFTGTVNSANHYVYDATSQSWNDASTDAAASTYDGQSGHLVTVTSDQENKVVGSVAPGNIMFWIGASDSAVEGEWRWVEGPEGLEEAGAGRQFWQGAAVGGAVGGNYANWVAGQPNNVGGGGGQDYAVMYGYGHASNGTWHDTTGNNGAVYEYELDPTALSITANNGTVAFNGAVGSSQELSGLSVNAQQIDFDSTLNVGGNIDLNSAGAMSFDNTVTTSSGGTVTLTNTGALTIAAAADMTLDGAFVQDGSGAVSTAGDITTTNDLIQFDGDLTLTGHTALDSGAGAGHLLLNGTVDGTVAGAQNLTLDAGTGNVTLADAVGSTALGNLTIDGTNIAFSNTLAVEGNIDIDAAGTVGFSNAVTTTGGGTTTITNAGTLTVAAAADMSLDGAFNQDGAGAVALSGDITTSDDNISWSGDLTLGGDVVMDAGTATVTLSGAAAAGANAFTITADEIDFAGGANSITGTGNILLQPSTVAATIGIGGGAGTLDLNDTDLAALQNGFSLITLGRSNGTGDIAVDAFTFYDPYLIRSAAGDGDVTISGTLTGSAAGSLTVQAGDKITVDSGADILSSSGALDIILNADRDGSSAGNIEIGSGSVINSNGGEILLSGGSGTTADLRSTGFAWGTAAGGTNNRGILLDGAQLLSGAGNITVRGTGVTAVSTINQGVDIVGSSIVESTTGAINIVGVGGSAGTANESVGVVIYNGSRVSNTTSGDITITGTGGDGTGTRRIGVYVVNNSVVRSEGTGQITLTGTGGSNGSGSANYGIYVEDSSRIEGVGANAIGLNGTGGNGSVGIASLTGSNLIGEGPFAGVYSGTVTLTADKMSLHDLTLQTSALALLQNATAGLAIDLGSATDAQANTLELSSTELDNITAGTLRIGRTGGTATGAITISGDIAPSGAPILSLLTGSTVSQQAGDTITATNLAVTAGGAVTLTQNNDADTLAINTSSGAVQFTDADSFVIGTVDGISGIVTTGAANISLIASDNGGTEDITINEDVSTGSGTISISANDSIDINANIGASTPNAVTLAATNGAIVQSSADTIDATTLTISSATTVGTSLNPFLTNIGSLVLSATDDVHLTEVNALTLSDIDVADGTLTISAGGTLTATDVNVTGVGEDVSLSTSTGGMTLTSVLSDDAITASATNGDITVGLVGDAGTGAVSITATNGAIDSNSDDGTADVRGTTVSLTAGSGGIGTSTVLDVTASTSLSANSSADNSNIVIDSIGDLTAGLITAGSGNVTLDSTGDIDSLADNGVADVVGSVLTLTAASGGIGANSVLDISAATSLSADTTADNGTIAIDSIGDLSVVLVDAGNGSITLDSSGDIDSVTDNGVADVSGGAVNLIAASGGIGNTSVVDVAASTSLSANTTADNSNIVIDSIGDLTAGLIAAGSGNVTLDSTGDIDSLADNGVADVVGSVLTLTAVSGGIGSASVLDISAATSLSADTTADNGTIAIDSIGDLSVVLVDAGIGSVTLDSTGDIDSVTDNGTADVRGGAVNLIAAVGGIGNTSGVDVAASTSLSANTTADNSNIVIDSIGDLTAGLITAGSGNVTLDSTGDIDSLADNGVADVVGSVLMLTAASGGIGNTSGVDVAASTSLSADTTADNSNIVIDSIGDLTAGLITAGSGDVTLDSTGDIDSLTNNGVADVVGSVLTLTAASGGIGANSVLDISAATSLSADTTTDNGTIAIDSIGDLSVVLVDAGIGSVTLDSTGDIDSVTDNGVNDIRGGTVSLIAASGGIGNTSVLDVTAGTSLSASTVADNSNILIDSIGNLTAGLITAGSGNVTLDSTGDIDSLADNGVADVVGSVLTLTAASGGIGSNSVLDISAATSLSADTSADNGTIAIDSIGDLSVVLVDAGNGSITLDSTGDIDSVTDNGVADVSGGAVNLIAASGGIGNTSVVDVAASTSLSANTTADNSNIVIDSIGDLTAGLISAGSGNVTLDSTGDIDSLADNGVADVVGSVLTLTAASGGMGSNSVLDISAATSLSADTTADNGTIAIDSIGNLSVVLVDAGNGSITLDSTGDIDSVTDNGFADVSGGAVNLIAASGGIGNTSVVDVAASTSFSASSSADNSNILIDSIGNLTAGLITAGSGNVTLDSTGDIDSLADNGIADVVGSVLTLTAASGGIGANSVLDISAATSLSADTTADNGTIAIDSIGDLSVVLVDAGNGSITLDSTGDIDSVTDNGVADVSGGAVNLIAASGGIGNTSVVDVAASTSLSANTIADNSNILIDSIGNLTAGLITAGSGNVTLDSTGDIDSLADNGVADIVGSVLTLTAASGGIGNASVLDVAASTSLSTSTTADNSNIVIDSIGDLTVGLITAGSGNVTLDSTGDIDSLADNGVADVAGSVLTLTAASGGIGSTSVLDISAAMSLSADTTADNGIIAIDSIGDLSVVLVDAGIGSVTLDSTGDIDSVTDNGVADVRGGTVSLIAASGGIGNTSVLDVTASTSLSTNTTADNSNIVIDSIGDLTVGLITAGSGNVTLDSTGDIDSLADNGVADVAGSVLTLMAASGGIGSASVLDISAATSLSANATADNGIIAIDSIGDLSVVLVDAGIGSVTLDSTGDIDSVTDNGVADVRGGTVSLIAASGGIGNTSVLDVTASTSLSANTTGDNGNIVVDSIGDLTVGLITAGNGNVTLDSTGDIDSLANNNVADIVGSMLTLTAASGGIGNGSTLDVTASGSFNADTSADNADVRVDGIGNLNVGVVNAGSGNAVLSATAGIVDANGVTTNVTSTNLTLSAVTGIGHSDALELMIDFLQATNTTSGDIRLSNSGALSLIGTGINNQGGSLFLTGSAGFTFTRPVQTASHVTIDMQSSILDDGENNIVDLITGGNATLKSHNGVIGFSSDPIEVNVGGVLSILAGGMDGTISASFSGTTQGNTVTLLQTPPGLAIFNVVRQGGGTIDVSDQSINLQKSEFVRQRNQVQQRLITEETWRLYPHIYPFQPYVGPFEWLIQTVAPLPPPLFLSAAEGVDVSR